MSSLEPMITPGAEPSHCSGSALAPTQAPVFSSQLQVNWAQLVIAPAPSTACCQALHLLCSPFLPGGWGLGPQCQLPLLFTTQQRQQWLQQQQGVSVAERSDLSLSSPPSVFFFPLPLFFSFPFLNSPTRAKHEPGCLVPFRTVTTFIKRDCGTTRTGRN